MPVLLVAILDNPSLIWDVLDAWDTVGVGDATVLDSTGLHHARRLRDDLPLFPSVRDLLDGTDAHHSTILSVVEDHVDLDAVARATESVVGPLDQPHTGLLFTIPVVRMWGFRAPRKHEG